MKEKKFYYVGMGCVTEGKEPQVNGSTFLVIEDQDTKLNIVPVTTYICERDSYAELLHVALLSTAFPIIASSVKTEVIDINSVVNKLKESLTNIAKNYYV